MTYLGVDPYKNLSRFTSLKPASSYPEETMQNIKLLSFSKNKLATTFGSYIYRIQRFPGDVDLIEEFTECCTLPQVIAKFERTLKRIVRKILKMRLHYYSEVKAGVDIRYDTDIGEMKNGIYTPNPNLDAHTYSYYEIGLLSREENNIIQYILQNVKNFGAREYDAITYIYRERKILRWSAQEILKGVKKLPPEDKKKITLKEALHHQSYLKIDMIASLGSKLVEVTNFLQLAFEDKFKDIHLINIDFKINQEATVALPREIERLYFSDMFYSPFKMVKRLYSLARHNNDKDLLHKIIPFISSNASLLYQVKSQIDTIILVIERSKSFPKKLIEKELEEAKLSISTVLELNKNEILQINDFVEKVNKTVSKKQKIELLKKLKKLVFAHINAMTIEYLERVGLNPPPSQYLPPKHTYDTSRVRGVAEIPENPVNYYKALVSELGKDVVLEPPDLGEEVLLDFPLKPQSFVIKKPIFITKEPKELEAIKEEFRKLLEEEPEELEKEREIERQERKLQKKMEEEESEEKEVILPSAIEELKALEKKSKKGKREKRKAKRKSEKTPTSKEIIQRPPTKEPTIEELQRYEKTLTEEEKLISEVLDELETFDLESYLRKYRPGSKEEKAFLKEKEETRIFLAENDRQALKKYLKHAKEHKKEYTPEKYLEETKDLLRAAEELEFSLDELREFEEAYKEAYEEALGRKGEGYRRYGGYNVYYPIPGTSHYPNFFDPAESKAQLAQRILSNPGLRELPKEDQKLREMIDEQLEEHMKTEMMKKLASKDAPPHLGVISEGNVGGYSYSHNFKIPLYMNEVLPMPKLLQNEMQNHSTTAASYASDYHHRGYGPSLKPPHIINAPLVWFGEILPGVQRAGCEDCGLREFRHVH